MAPTKRLNVLIYTGTGASLSSVRHATWSLRRLLGPHYAVLTVSADQILKEPWSATCALLVMPGGADSGYCRTLNGDGNRKIKRYVQLGGKYLGLCAGGYYGSARCEFEVGKKGMEVVGDRELAFFPGICRGLAYPGFVYASEAGARAVEILVNKGALSGVVVGSFRSYYNGGGTFVDAEKMEETGVEVLASFAEKLAVESGEAKAAVVYCKVGEGAAVLTGPHPEFCGINLNRDEPSNPDYGHIVDALTADDEKRADFMKACLAKLGLEVSQETTPVPSLSHLHLSSAKPSDVADLVATWREAGILTTENNSIYIKGENDTFHLLQTDGWSMASVAQAVAEISPKTVQNAISASSSNRGHDKNATDDTSRDRILDYNLVTKTLVPHPTSHPDAKSTPHFNHAAFFQHLQTHQSRHPGLAGDYGRTLLYAEVLTSTQTILDKNPTWLSHLPIGTTAVATTQVSGRGRGNNVWVSPPGSLMFTTLLKHPLALSTSAPVVFVQYIAALAIVEGIHSYSNSASTQQSKAYASLPVKLKWPNDIYALSSPSADPKVADSWTKIAGILVNSSYASADYTLLVGIGLNALNAQPTTSLAQIFSSAGLPPPQLEALLASILVSFEALYARFCRCGWDDGFQEMYYKHWLHEGQVVKLEQEGGLEVRVKGISSDWGMLVVEEVVKSGRGRRWELMSDGNSFDFFKGLVKRKV
ncbi:unnamed protein product [Zymoseptoria tritici ST99CH_1A5]|uniref:BPL/LPL catalytic domain-containing protein n=1 Tax=Zymoseptoria tritici ST99CH_1A5 TaxID=1276529 RepID=A0A1Y6LED1_ZYMTR|nr:unnamed protein product [Zymoseptoria tritici ST99CH_1A5]